MPLLHLLPQLERMLCDGNVKDEWAIVNRFLSEWLGWVGLNVSESGPLGGRHAFLPIALPCTFGHLAGLRR